MCKKRNETPNGELSMKWHKFLLLLLWLGAALNLITGPLYIFGMFYEDPTMVYQTYPALMTFDMVFGVAMMVVAIFQFVVRRRLKKLCANGPALLVVSYIVTAITTVASYVAPMIIAPGVMDIATSDISGAVIGAVFWIAVNSAYYKKRKDMFTN